VIDDIEQYRQSSFLGVSDAP